MVTNTIQSRLIKSLAENSNRCAIEHGKMKMSYNELDQRSNVIAHTLMARGLKKGTFVAIIMQSRVELIASLIGILKAGCVFIPIDVNYPRDRIKVMIKTTDAKYILTDGESLASFSDFYVDICEDVEIIDIDMQNKKNDICLEGPVQAYNSDDRLYVYFTSGSTGGPKAIVGRNESLLHFINWEIEEFDITENIRVSQFTSPCHNPFLRDIFVPLFTGGTICIPDNRETMLESNSLMEWIEISHVSLIHCTPNLFKLINGKSLSSENFSQLQYIMFGGERIIPKDLISWYDIIGERVQLVSLYGQTETTLAKLFYRIKSNDVKKMNIPIGKPIEGAKATILDKDLQLCIQGAAGEIHIRTPYMTHGYYNNPKLNNEKFIANPFNNDPKDIIYCTGDLGRFLQDGNIEFLGRMDRQIKIRGFRVELDEIENTLLQHKKIKETVVISKSNKQGNVFISAYIILNSNDYPSKSREQILEEIRNYLSSQLPDYMIPQYITIVEKFQLNLNGKIDYKALPEPEVQKYIAPIDEIESMLSEIWCEILGVKKVGRKNKFLESGGHSLNVISLIFKVHQEYNVELPLAEVLNDITLEEMANYIRKAKTNSLTNL